MEYFKLSLEKVNFCFQTKNINLELFQSFFETVKNIKLKNRIRIKIILQKNNFST
jgi:hypothetical protein